MSRGERWDTKRSRSEMARRRYKEMVQVTQAITWAITNGICPICAERPRGRWRGTGVPKITCDEPACMSIWLDIKPRKESKL